MIKKIISFSLWGGNPKYTQGAIENIICAQRFYPGWICRFYVSSDVPNDILSQLVCEGTEVIRMDGAGWNGMFWRFLAADGDDVVISRDTDSRLGMREATAVEEWLQGDKDFHIMRDHPYHKTEILGGMWGARNGVLKGISSKIEKWPFGHLDGKYQVDQEFLKQIIYPEVKDLACVHDEFFEKIPFPKNAPPRTPSDFVGQVYNEFNQPEFC